jgi:hypothetical protein
MALSQPSSAGKKLKVLFIGNSYTYVNNLPQITADVAASMGDTLAFDSYTVGGYSFRDHYFDPLSAVKIKSEQWDYIILQEQSMLPSQPRNSFFGDSYYWAAQLDTMIAANDPCSKVLFYMTWGYKNGDPNTCANYPSWPYVCTYEGMDSLTNLRYRTYADTTLLAAMGYIISAIGVPPVRPSLVAPVGAVRHYIRHHYPAIELYQPDDSHPTPAGSYAGACTFYAAMFRKDPTLIPYNYVLNTNDAANIKTAAKLVTYDSMSKWHLGSDLRAQFIANVTAGNNVSFVNISTSAASYIWDFGDGTTSVVPNPIHTYANSGVYTTKLIAFSASCSDTTFAVVNTSSTGIGNLSAASTDFIVSPNPATDILNIHSAKFPCGSYQVSIANILGQTIYFKECLSADEQIDISGFKDDIYIISIKTGNNISLRYKIAKQ